MNKEVSNCRDLSKLKMGTSESDLKRQLGHRGIPLFKFRDSNINYICNLYQCKDTGVMYKLLIRDGNLIGVSQKHTNDEPSLSELFLEPSNNLNNDLKRFQRLSAFYETDLKKIDFTRIRPKYRPPTIGGFLMWAPLMPVFLPLTLPSLAHGDSIYKKAFSLKPGDSYNTVVDYFGTPDIIDDKADNYRLVRYNLKTIATENARLNILLGVMNEKIEWIIFGGSYY